MGTTRGTNGPQGGRFTAYDNVYRHNGLPQLDGFVCFRIASATYWYLDGYATTIDVRATAGGPELTAWEFTGSVPSAAAIAAAGITPETHFIVGRV